MRPIDKIASVIIIGITIIIVSLIFIQMSTRDGCGCIHGKPSPAFIVDRINATTINMTVVDLGGASSIKGLNITMPTMANPEVISQNVEIVVGQSIILTDSNLTYPTHLVVTSWVDISSQIVVDTEI